MTYKGKLTAAHQQLIDETRDQWMAAGLSTDRADRAAAERLVADAYTAAGIAPPAITIWMDSPLEVTE